MKEWCTGILNRWLPRGGFARNASVLAGGTAAAQAIAIAAAPVLTRVYTPRDFGAFQIYLSLLGLALVAGAWRYEIALLLPEDEQSAIDILGLAILCVCISASVAAGIVIFCQYKWLLPASVLVLRNSLWILPVSMLGGGLYQSLSYWAMRHRRYRQIASTKLAQVGTQVGTQLGAGFLLHGSLGLLIGDALGRMVGSERFLAELWRTYARQICAIRFPRMIKLALRYRAYPLVSMWGALINSSGLAIPSLFLAQYYGAQNTGWFALVNRVLGVPAALISASIAQVYTSEAAKLARSDPARLMHVFLKTTRRMVLVGIVPCTLFAIAAPSFFQAVFGHAWREAGEYARYLAFMFYAGFINSPVQMTLLVLERQQAQFIWDVARLLLTILAIVLPHHYHHGARAAIALYGVAMTVMYGIHWAQSYFVIKAHVDRMRIDPLKHPAAAQ